MKIICELNNLGLTPEVKREGAILMTPSPANKCVSIVCSHFLRAFIVFHSLSIVPNSSRLRH